MKQLAILILVISISLIGCQKKVEPVKVGQLIEYKDPAFGFKIKYLAEWKSLGEAGRAKFAKSQDVIEKFLDPRTGEEGAEVSVEMREYKGGTIDDIILEGKEELKQTWQNIQVLPDEKVTIAGKEVTKINYAIPVTTKKQISGYDIYFPGDTAVYKITCLGYGEQYAAHTDAFLAMVNSFEPPVVVLKQPDQWTPSPTMQTYTSNFFTMQYPENLEFVPVKKGSNDDLAVEMRADRLDCSIHIAVFGAKNLTVDKVWTQNKAKYNVRNSGDIKIDDQNAYWADYSPRKDIGSRVYFTVKNDKVVRITINYYAPQKNNYFPTFENMVKSIKLK
jgi:hypothetical protein